MNSSGARNYLIKLLGMSPGMFFKPQEGIGLIGTKIKLPKKRYIWYQ